MTRLIFASICKFYPLAVFAGLYLLCFSLIMSLYWCKLSSRKFVSTFPIYYDYYTQLINRRLFNYTARYLQRSLL